MEQIIVKPGDSGQRLDKYLGKYFKEAPKSFLYKMMRKKNITLNGKKAQGNEILKEKDEIRLFLAAETIEKFRGSEKEEGVHGVLDIPYEDDQVLGNKSHIEKGQFVDHCTYKDRASKTSMPTVSIKSERISLGSYAMVIRGPSKIDILALPSGYSRSDLRYESEDEAIVSLDADGSITPLSNGVTKVRVYTADGEHEAYVNILVSIDEKEA